MIGKSRHACLRVISVEFLVLAHEFVIFDCIRCCGGIFIELAIASLRQRCDGMLTMEELFRCASFCHAFLRFSDISDIDFTSFSFYLFFCGNPSVATLYQCLLRLSQRIAQIHLPMVLRLIPLVTRRPPISAYLAIVGRR